MSTPWNLHRLYLLDPSSLDFLRHLYSLIRHDKEEQYSTSLQGSQLVRLVDFLDEVRAVPSAFHQFTKRTPQALSAVSVNDDISRQCLHRLQAICGHHATLPSSYIISGGIVRVGDGPIALGTIAEVWEGAYHSKRVSIKCLSVPLNDDQTLKEVRVQCGASLSCLLKNTCGHYSHSSETPLCGKG